ncbi:hypothetical protein C5167_038730 [Papaver somniferum]|uniref:Uncharacterized protein n=1 Tax=Papaver somniferum TaxID=3469 RepID=A0A4Y7IEE3_PAPSO|nr:hypothetical protein C5167_038730 [Papaver somniferum]
MLGLVIGDNETTSKPIARECRKHIQHYAVSVAQSIGVTHLQRKKVCLVSSTATGDDLRERWAYLENIGKMTWKMEITWHDGYKVVYRNGSMGFANRYFFITGDNQSYPDTGLYIVGINNRVSTGVKESVGLLGLVIGDNETTAKPIARECRVKERLGHRSFLYLAIPHDLILSYFNLGEGRLIRKIETQVSSSCKGFLAPTTAWVSQQDMLSNRIYKSRYSIYSVSVAQSIGVTRLQRKKVCPVSSTAAGDDLRERWAYLENIGFGDSTWPIQSGRLGKTQGSKTRETDRYRSDYIW